MTRAISPKRAWRAHQTGDAQILDLRTHQERRRYGWPPGASKVALVRHLLWPRRDDAIYLCQHANRSKLTGWRGAPEIQGGWEAWQRADLPVEKSAQAH